MYSRQVFKDSLTKQTIGKENDPSRYFTSSDLFELFKTGDFTRAKVCDEFNELHGTLEDKLYKNLADDAELSEEQRSVLEHKERIKRAISEIYDISEHSLVFSKNTERLNENHADYAHLNEEVRTARELIRRETQAGAGSANSRTLELDTGILSAKQKLLTQKFGTEFLPLGAQNNFNRYRDGSQKFEFRKPKPKSPLKIVNLDDDEDEIQADRFKKPADPPSLSREQSTSSLSSVRSTDSFDQSLSSSRIHSTDNAMYSRMTSSSSSPANSSGASNLARWTASSSSVAPSPIKAAARSPAKSSNRPEMVDLSHDLSMMSVDGAAQGEADSDGESSDENRVRQFGRNEPNRSESNGTQGERNESSTNQSNRHENSESENNESEDEARVNDEESEEDRFSNEGSDGEGRLRNEERFSNEESDEERLSSDENNQLSDDESNRSNLLSSDESDLDEVVNSFNMSIRIDPNKSSNQMDDSIIILD